MESPGGSEVVQRGELLPDTWATLTCNDTIGAWTKIHLGFGQPPTHLDSNELEFAKILFFHSEGSCRNFRIWEKFD